MGSIRPLVTITILAVVGVYLYVKINEGPVPTPAGTNALSQSPEGVPPLTGTKGTTLAAESDAPAWPSTATSTAPPTPNAVPTATTVNPPTKVRPPPRRLRKTVCPRSRQFQSCPRFQQ